MLKIRILLLLIPLFSNFSSFDENIANGIDTVVINGMKFHPDEIIVQKGDIIVWINKDIVAHNVTEEKMKAWTSSIIPSGESWKMVVKQSSSYFCSLHPVMKGTIKVK
jgi:plastocyanin